jgi:LuxR family transcriptional regulator, maltose regulon positive regulatory protein
MSTPILATKLFIPPQQKNLVVRPRLLEKLDEGLYPGRRLTLVCAPAGFGKTTLVRTWVASLRSSREEAPPSVTWVSLDNGDNDPVIFWSYIISGFQAAEKGVGNLALTFLQATPHPNLEQFLILLLNDLARISTQSILVLDDYHLMRDPEIHKSLSSLIDHLPADCHVLILSRTDPPLPLALLRGRGQLQEIRLADLRFSTEEASAYLNDAMKLALPGIDVETLNVKTEGWAAGLQMAGISMQGRPDKSRFIQTFSGSNRYILDYLTDEILNRQPAQFQTFLLYTSILENMSAPLCEAVVGIPGGGQFMLERLDQANLFLIPLDNERRQYRYHHLFSEILQAKLTHSDPKLIPILQKRAAAWFETNGMLEEAVFYTHAAKDNAGLVRLLEENVGPIRKKGHGIILRKWAQLLPEEMVSSSPWLCILSAWSHLSSAEVAQAEPFLDRAEQLVHEKKSNENNREILGNIYALRTEILHTRADIPGTIKMARQALELLDPADIGNLATVNYSLVRAYYASGDLMHADQVCSDILQPPVKATIHGIYAFIIGIRGTILAIKGKLQEGIVLYRQAIDYMIANDIEQFFISGNPYGGLGMLLYQENELEQAENLIDEALRHYQRWGNLNALSVGLSNRTSVRIARGNLDGAMADMRAAEHIIRGFKPYFDVSSIFLASRVRFFLAKGDISAATRLFDENNLSSDDPLSFQHEQDHITLSRVLIARCKFSEADTLLARLAEAARQAGRFGRLIEILNLRAAALQALGKNSEALQILETSLALAEPAGYVRVFVDEGEPMETLLVLAGQNDIHPEFAGRLLAAFPDSVPQEPAALDVQKSNLALIEPLSQRELEVLRLIAAGMANKEIGQRLSVSLRTVKFHAANIYLKLGVNRRQQATVKARELRLLK